MRTRDKTKSALVDILVRIVSDDAPSIGSDDTLIDLETDAKLTILALRQLHNKLNHGAAKRNGYEFSPKPICECEIESCFRGGYDSDFKHHLKSVLLHKFESVNMKEEVCINNI